MHPPIATDAQLATTRYATMTASEVLATSAALLAQYASEDADRAARLASILAL